MFKREHHTYIATVLQSLNADLLKKSHCLFGGGTAIALAHNEYRESVDIDFLVSDPDGYKNLRQMLTQKGINAIARRDAQLTSVQDIRADQYGIRTMLHVGKAEIKFEIVREARIQLQKPIDSQKICGVSVLTNLDMATTKLLANSDRWSDDSVYSRDLIDLAMLEPDKALLQQAIEKATIPYGNSVVKDLNKAIEHLSKRKNRLEDCMNALKIESISKAVLWNRIRSLKM